MSATSLVQFNAQSSAVTLFNEKTGMTGARLMSAKEFKTAKGLKGSEGKKQFNAYLRLHGLDNNVGFSEKLTRKEVFITSGKCWESGRFQISGILATKVVDPVDKAGSVTLSAEENAKYQAYLAACTAVAPAA
jgi:hypothetical protein